MLEASVRFRLLAGLLLLLGLALFAVPVMAEGGASDRKVKVVFVYMGQEYDLSEKPEILKNAYDEDWRSSIAWRTQELVTKDVAIRDQMALLQSRDGTDVTIRVHYDSLDRLYAGQ